MSKLWDLIRGKGKTPKPTRIKPPAPPRTPARPYDQPVTKTPEQYLRDGGDRSRQEREDRAYDSTVERLRRDREALARDNDRLRRDRDLAWGGNVPSGMYYDPHFGDYVYRDGLYHGNDVVDLTAEGHHHEPDVVVVEEHHHHYDHEDDYESHLREDHEADQSAAETQADTSSPEPAKTDEQFYGRDSDFYGGSSSSSDSSYTSSDTSSGYGGGDYGGGSYGGGDSGSSSSYSGE